MSEKTFKQIKTILSWLLFTVSFYLVFLTLTSFAPWGTFQFFGWALLSAIIVILQMVFIVEIKTAWRTGSGWGKKLFLIFGYSIFTIITLSGSLLFSVSTVETKNKRVVISGQDIQEEIETTKNRIKTLEEENALYFARINDYLMKNQVTLSAPIKKYMDANEVKIQGQEIVTNATFEKIASKMPFNISGIAYQYFMLILISLGIDFGLFVTAEPLGKQRLSIDLTETKKEIAKYIDALFDIDGVRLNSDKKIEEITHIPLKNCIRYKKLLQEQVYNGKPLLVSGKGGTKSNFSKEDVIRIITFVLNTQKEIL